MRIVYCTAGGDMGLFPLRRLVEHHEVVALVRPASPRRSLRAWGAALRRQFSRRPADPLVAFAHEQDVPTVWLAPGHDASALTRLRAMRPDVLCIATFPWLLPATLYTIPRYGAINVHPSLLPRHRGPNPLFWLYYHDDRSTGVTVHAVTERADAGDILLQDAFPLPRGYSILSLHHDKAQRGAALLVQALRDIAAGHGQRRVQDRTLVTRAPRVQRGTPMVDFAAWEVERVWHFLAGLYPQFVEPLQDRQGRRQPYSQVLGYAPQTHTQRPGSLEAAPYGWNLYCRGGVVKLAAAALRPARETEAHGLRGQDPNR